MDSNIPMIPENLNKIYTVVKYGVITAVTQALHTSWCKLNVSDNTGTSYGSIACMVKIKALVLLKLFING